MKTLILLMSVLFSGCSVVGNIYNAMDSCQPLQYSGKTPEERARQMPRYCGPSGSTYLVRTSTAGLNTLNYVNVQSLDQSSGYYYSNPSQTVKQIYGNIKVDEHGRILNWNELK